ncbi:MAG: hypothetical protein ABFR95_02525 [Actinomycetota bacterium]
MTSDPEERANLPIEEEDEDPGWPWSFLLLVAAGGIYLILRFVQMINDYILN